MRYILVFEILSVFFLCWNVYTFIKELLAYDRLSVLGVASICLSVIVLYFLFNAEQMVNKDDDSDCLL